MSTAPAPVKPPSARDYQYAVNNLARTYTLSQDDARAIYEESRFHWKTAVAIVEARKRTEAQRQAEAEFEQFRLLALYDARIRPALRRWHYYEATFDPMRNPADRFRLWQKLTDDDVAVVPTKEGNLYRLHITTPAVNGAWRSGEGISEEYHEALILAWWQAFEGVV